MKKVYIEVSKFNLQAYTELYETIPKLFVDVELTQQAQVADYQIFLTAEEGIQKPWESISEQSFHISCTDGHTLYIQAGSASALFWGVCELTAMWGVMHLVSGDHYPEKKQAFYLPEGDWNFAPRQRIREWRVISDFLSGGEGRTLEGQKKLIRQLARMKANSIRIDIWLSTPFLDYSIMQDGQLFEKKGGLLHCAQIFEVQEDSLSAQFVKPTKCFTNPEWQDCTDDDEISRRAHKYIAEIIQLAKEFDMRVSLSFEPFDYPTHFAPLLDNPVEVNQLGGQRVGEGKNILGEKSLRLVNMVFDAVLTQYPQADVFVVAMPEHARDSGDYQQAVDYLDQRFHICEKYDIEKMLVEDDTQKMALFGDGRSQREGRMNLQLITGLHKVFEKTGILEKLTAMGKRVSVAAGVVTPVMIPVYLDVLAPDIELIASSYTAARNEKCLHAYDYLRADHATMMQVLTFEDDNIGGGYQTQHSSLSRLLDFNIEHGICGYMTRFWPTGDLDEMGYCLSEASWKPMSISEVLPVFLKKFYGSQAKNVEYAMSAAQGSTVLLDALLIDFLFQCNNRLVWHIGAGKEGRDDTPLLMDVALGYTEAECLLRKAAAAADITNDARQRLEYLAMRMYFTTQMLYQRRFISQGNQCLRDGKVDEAEALYQQGLNAALLGLKALAAGARDDNDVGNLVVNEHLFITEAEVKMKKVLANARAK